MKREGENGGRNARRPPVESVVGEGGGGASREAGQEATVEGKASASLPTQTITIEEINGRLTELGDLNAMLMARCATMRGQLAQRDAQIGQLTRELAEARKEKPQ